MAEVKGTIRITPDGDVAYEITQAQGPTCRTAMQPLVAALGGDEEVVLKPEYHVGVVSDFVQETPLTIQSGI